MSRPRSGVLIVDDHPVFRMGMSQLVAEDPTLNVVAEAESGASALQQLDGVDIVVTDFDMPEISGLELARELTKRAPWIKTILLTMHENEELFNEAINSGVTAYVLKDDALVTIHEAIRSAIRGEHYVSPALSKFVFRRAKKSKSFRKEHKGLSLTPTELKVLRGIAHGQTSQEIASELGVSYRTITTHRNNISQKLNLTGNHPLLNFALSNKSSILSLPE